MTDTSDLLAAARGVGRLVWIESRLFEIVGRWVATTPEPTAKVFLATASRRHGEHAEMLSTLVPVVAGGPTFDELVVADEALLAGAARLEHLEGTDARLRSVWRDAMPAVIAAAEAHTAATSAVADAAGLRILGAVIAEHRAEMVEAERVLAELFPT